ncbi:MAG TPA: cupin [Oligoflexia bacterium]|nr:cupin [Oligoflexia bacterium]HMR24841.1 cupin [Oligoflexia bacterium]
MKNSIKKFPLHLGLDAKIFSEPMFTGFDWYESYGKRHANDGKEGRLVSLHTFEESWDAWEQHPEGDEVVLCLEGRLTLIQEISPETYKEITLEPYEYVINPKGVWHTADTQSKTTALFITAGLGTQHKPRTKNSSTL